MKVSFWIFAVAVIFAILIGSAGTALIFKLIAIILPIIFLVLVVFGFLFGIAVSLINTIKVFCRIDVLRSKL